MEQFSFKDAYSPMINPCEYIGHILRSMCAVTGDGFTIWKVLVFGTDAVYLKQNK